MSISIINGRLIDPAHGIDDRLDLHLDGEVVVAVGDAPAEFVADEVIDARGLVVCPGLVDLAASLREPGYEHKATLASEAMASMGAVLAELVMWIVTCLLCKFLRAAFRRLRALYSSGPLKEA